MDLSEKILERCEELSKKKDTYVPYPYESPTNYGPPMITMPLDRFRDIWRQIQYLEMRGYTDHRLSDRVLSYIEAAEREWDHGR